MPRGRDVAEDDVGSACTAGWFGRPGRAAALMRFSRLHHEARVGLGADAGLRSPITGTPNLMHLVEHAFNIG